MFGAQIIWFACQSQPTAQEVVNDLDVVQCLTELSDETMDIISWNLRDFPIDELFTVEQVARLIEKEDADLVAFQEIQSEEDFNRMMYLLPEWGSEIVISGGLNLGFIYKKTEIVLIGHAYPIFSDDHFAFPRAPIMLEVVHTSGIEATLINLHLKCCGGEENELRRREASTKLKDFLDENHPDDPIIVLGDFNGMIAGITDVENVFIDFINDAANYRFADMAIAAGPKEWWSYPSYPSHIDHLLISNELFYLNPHAATLTYDLCDGRYFRHISDHRPVLLRLNY